MRLDKITEVLAFDWNDRPCFDPEFRLPDARDILTICSSLVVISAPRTTISGSNEEVQLAHSSVRDFLVSEGVLTKKNPSFTIKEPLAHEFITQICLSYLIYISKEGVTDEEMSVRFPLAGYSAQYWVDHFLAAECSDDLVDFAIAFFQDDKETFVYWRKLFDIDKP